MAANIQVYLETILETRRTGIIFAIAGQDFCFKLRPRRNSGWRRGYAQDGASGLPKSPLIGISPSSSTIG